MFRRPPPARPAALFALLGLAACAHGARPAPEAAPVTRAAVVDSCIALPSPATEPESLTIAVTEPVDPGHAPRPRNAAERFVFAQLYEPLLRIDCRGALQPGLAERWSTDSTGRRVTLTLGHATWSATREPVAVNDLVAGGTIRPGALDATLANLGDPGTLIVELHDSIGASDTTLADPRTAPVRALPDTPWPQGTTGYVAHAVGESEIRLAPLAGATQPLLSVRIIPERAARDVLDEGVDLLITRDPAAVRYASTRDDLVSTPLPWDRKYVLLLPPLAPADASTTHGSGPGSDSASHNALRRALAVDAVREEARPASASSWWNALAGCPRLLPLAATVPPPAHSASPARRIVYPRDDAAARAIAERLVALASTHDRALGALAASLAAGTAPLAEPMDSSALGRALTSGSATGYVIALPARTLDACRETLRLLERAPWLAADTGTVASHVVPLVDTRPRAIARRGALGLRIDGVGALRIVTRAPESP